MVEENGQQGLVWSAEEIKCTNPVEMKEKRVSKFLETDSNEGLPGQGIGVQSHC